MRGLGLHNSKLTLEVRNGVVENLNILKPLLILILTLAQSGLQDLNLLVEKGKLVVAANQLSTQDVTLVNDFRYFFLLFLVLNVRFLDDVGQFVLRLLHLLIVALKLLI